MCLEITHLESEPYLSAYNEYKIYIYSPNVNDHTSSAIMNIKYDGMEHTDWISNDCLCMLVYRLP